MRFKEFKLTINEFVQPAGDPGNDLAYLITHTELSPELKKMIGATLKGLASAPETTPVAPPTQPQAQQPVQTQQPVAPVQPKTPVGEPMGQEPVDQDDEQLREAATPEETELLAYIKSVKNKAELGKLLYVVRDGQFKKLASEIVKNKIKFKPRETYELIKNRIRSLSTRVPVAVMTDFLNTCKESGVIDTEGMISGDIPDQTRIPLVDARYQKIAEAFLDLNLERLGKGEIGLAFMGINAVKETSDISIGGQAIEVKATKGKSDFFMKGNPDEGGFGHQAEAVKILVNALNKVGANLKPTNRSKQGGIAAIGRTNLPKLNQYFAVLRRKGTYQVLMDVLKELNKKNPKIVDLYSDEIHASINPDGTVDYNILGTATAKINFDYYKQMSHHDGVMVLNLNSFQFVYITDANTWASYVNSNVLQQMYALDFRTNGLGGISYTMNAFQ